MANQSFPHHESPSMALVQDGWTPLRAADVTSINCEQVWKHPTMERYAVVVPTKDCNLAGAWVLYWLADLTMTNVARRLLSHPEVECVTQSLTFFEPDFDQLTGAPFIESQVEEKYLCASMILAHCYMYSGDRLIALGSGMWRTSEPVYVA